VRSLSVKGAMAVAGIGVEISFRNELEVYRWLSIVWRSSRRARNLVGGSAVLGPFVA
jgi:hypothetical protein